MLQLNQIKAQVSASVLTAVILALLVAAWQLLTDGGLVSALGGATKSDLGSFSPTPSGAVIAFDLPDGCPKGWSDFTDGQGRTIIGATVKESSPSLEEGLSRYKFRESGGKEEHTLQIPEMPIHSHGISDPEHSHRVAGGFSAKDRDNEPGGGELTNGGLARGSHHSDRSPSGITINAEGGVEPHPNMPPYIPLYFCKKD